MKEFIRLATLFGYKLMFLEKQGCSLSLSEGGLIVRAFREFIAYLDSFDGLADVDEVAVRMDETGNLDNISLMRVFDYDKTEVHKKIPIHLVDVFTRSLQYLAFCSESCQIFLGYRSEEAPRTEFLKAVSDVKKALSDICDYFEVKEKVI